MGYRLEEETVRKIALDLIKDIETMVWDSAEEEKTVYLKISAYNSGVIDMTNQVIEAIEALKNA